MMKIDDNWIQAQEKKNKIMVMIEDFDDYDD
jgi:hypothetical protein